MNLKNTAIAEEMLNAESPNTPFNQATQQSSAQWSFSSSSTPSLAQSPSQNKNFLNNLSTIYNDLPSSESTFSLAPQSASNYTLPNSNLINLNQEPHTATNLQQLNDQSKVFANSQFSSHYYNHHSLHAQPILNNSLVNSNLVNNSLVNNVYDFPNELSTTNGQKYLEQHGVQHVVSTTNNFHHYNISLHRPNAASAASLPAEPSINFHHHLQLDNNLLEQNQTNSNTSFLNSTSSALPLNKKRKKLEQSCLTNLNKIGPTGESPKNLAPLKSLIKKEPDQHQIDNQSKENKEINNCGLNRSLNQSLNDNYNNYDFYNNLSTELLEQNNQSNYSSNTFLDSVFQSIKFSPFQTTEWHDLYDEHFNKLYVVLFIFCPI